jgi:hypothetical protein
MGSCEYVLAFLGEQAVDRLPCILLTMMFSADHYRAEISGYATDFPVQVEGQIRVADGFGFDYVTPSVPIRHAKLRICAGRDGKYRPPP